MLETNNRHLKSKKQNVSAVKHMINCVLLTKNRNDNCDLRRNFPPNYARRTVKITRLNSLSVTEHITRPMLPECGANYAFFPHISLIRHVIYSASTPGL